MAKFPYLPLWTDDYLSATTHLTLEEHGAYLKLLLVAWRSPDCDLSNDPRKLATILGVGPKKFTKIWLTIGVFFDDAGDGRVTQKRLLEVRKKIRVKSIQQSQAGTASALKRKDSPSTGVATGVRTGSSTDRQHQETSNKKDSERNKKGKKESPPPTDVGSPPHDPLLIPDQPQPRTEANGTKRTILTDVINWQPDEQDYRYAEDYNLDPDRVLQDIRDWAANASPTKRRKRSPRAFWQKWVRDNSDRASTGRTAQPPNPGGKPLSRGEAIHRASERFVARGNRPRDGSG